MTNATASKDCPDQETLTDFLRGKLVPPDLDSCELHIETCQMCHETLRGLNPSDTLSSFVVKAMEMPASVPTDEQVARGLVQRLTTKENFDNRTGQLTSMEVMQDRAAEVLRHVTNDSEDATSLGVLDSFRLLELIGVGGTGVVFRAYDFSLNREVALKVLRPSLGDVARDRFVAEARATASIDHENVVTIYQVGSHERLAWIAMQWVPGETLESRLKREGTLDENEVRRLTGQIAKGLAEAHRRQLVHRDIKPANIWIGDMDQRARILDFGLVRITDNDPALTATGMLAGTPNFMSPEQTKGLELDARSDLFSLGCVMYQMLTGKLPFNASTILATLQSIQSQRPETPIQLGADCSDDLSDLTMALLEKQPGNRIQSADSLVKCFDLSRSQWPMRVASYAGGSNQETQTIALPSLERGGSGNWRWVNACLWALFGFGMWLFAPQIIRIATNQGELVIETDDQNVQVEVRENGELIRVLDASSGASFDVRSGNFEVSAIGKDGKSEFFVEPNKLVMSRGDREVVRVTLAKAATARSAQPEASVASGGHFNRLVGTVPATSKPQSVFEGKPFTYWLRIAQSEKECKARINAIAACGRLCESPEQFEQITAVLDELANAEQFVTSLEDGQWQPLSKEAMNKGLGRAVCTLSARQVVDYMIHQLENGNKLSLANTIAVLDVYEDSLGSKELTQAMENNVELINPQIGKWKTFLPTNIYEAFDALGYEVYPRRGNGMAVAVPNIGIFRGRDLAAWLGVLQNDQDPVTQAEALKASATLYGSAGQHQELSSLLNNYLQRHARLAKLQTESQYILYMGFAEAFEKLPAERVVDFLAFQLQHGSQVALLWTYAGLLSPRDMRKISLFTKIDIYSPKVLEELKPRAEELLTLCAKRPSVGAAELHLLMLFANRCQVFETASVKTNEAINRLLMRLPAVELFSTIDFLPDNLIEQGFFDQIKKELFSKDKSTKERDEILKKLLKLNESKLREKYFFVQKLIAEVIANQMNSSEPIQFDNYQEMKVYSDSLDLEKASEFRSSSDYFLKKGLRPVEISGPAVVARRLLDMLSDQLQDVAKDADPEVYKKNGLVAARVLHEIISQANGGLEKSESLGLRYYQLLKIEQDLDAIGRMGRGESGEFSGFVRGRKKFGPEQE